MFVPRAVLTLADGDLASHPERAAQPGVAELWEFALATEGVRLVGGQVKAAELEELVMMTKAPVASLRNDGQAALIGPPGMVCRSWY
jgi:hypothetical protein